MEKKDWVFYSPISEAQAIKHREAMMQVKLKRELLGD